MPDGTPTTPTSHASTGLLFTVIGMLSVIPLLLAFYLIRRLGISGTAALGDFLGLVAVGLIVWASFAFGLVLTIRALRGEKPLASVAQEPLGLPSGSVRAMLTLFVVLGYVALVIAHMITDKAIPSEISVIVTTVIGFYFGTRAGGKTVGQEFDAPISRSEFQATAGTDGKASGVAPFAAPPAPVK